MLVKTTNSTYELDMVGKRIRRLTGQNAPTEETGQDGEWRGFEYCTTPCVGRSLRVLWNDSRATFTSRVVFVGKVS